MSFVRSLLGGLPGKISFRATASSFLEATPHSTFSLFPIGMGRRFQSTEADAKDLVRSQHTSLSNIQITNSLYILGSLKKAS